MCIHNLLSPVRPRRAKETAQLQFESTSTLSIPVTPVETGTESEDDDHPYIVPRNALMRRTTHDNFHAFGHLKRLHNKKFPPHPTWADAMLSMKGDNREPIATLTTVIRDPKWPAFLVFPVPRGLNGKGFDIDLALQILHDDQLGFRLAYAIQTLKYMCKPEKLDPNHLTQFRKERVAKEIWKSLSLFSYLVYAEDNSSCIENFFPFKELWKGRKEGEVKAFWDELKRKGQAPLPIDGMGSLGIPFRRGQMRAASEDWCKDKINFDAEAWHKPVLPNEILGPGWEEELE
ncbi:hypothetical protein B0T20DRAFT_409960 [Sordaria brevicollis]|uniref:Uncharacterized protein n=1 Tax=Sordaria brevicollis TaxID=83679 RepID=A0AAE0PG75_SORBR|nr:hypothetical protein B0T20DRAFT_409960 [Sordaria brevicollis]